MSPLTVSVDHADHPTPLDQAEELLAALRVASSDHDRDDLVERIVTLTLDLADRAARGYRSRSLDIEDLMQVARLGLVKAVRGYDPTRGPGFAAYAVPTITGELKRHFRDRSWLVRPPRFLQELRARLVVEEETLRRSLRRDPSAQELAERLNVPVKTVEETRLALRGFGAESIDDLDQHQRPFEPVADGDPYGFVEDVDAVRRALPSLTAREKTILRLRFGEELTQAEIGALVGISQMQVSRILTSSLSRLRTLATAA